MEDASRRLMDRVLWSRTLGPGRECCPGGVPLAEVGNLGEERSGGTGAGRAGNVAILTPGSGEGGSGDEEGGWGWRRRCERQPPVTSCVTDTIQDARTVDRTGSFRAPRGRSRGGEGRRGSCRAHAKAVPGAGPDTLRCFPGLRLSPSSRWLPAAGLMRSEDWDEMVTCLPLLPLTLDRHRHNVVSVAWERGPSPRPAPALDAQELTHRTRAQGHSKWPF